MTFDEALRQAGIEPVLAGKLIVNDDTMNVKRRDDARTTDQR